MTTGRVARPFYSSSAQIGFLHRIFITVNVLCLSTGAQKHCDRAYIKCEIECAV